MEKEKFDTVLRSVILEQEEKSVYSFNRNKVWRKSTDNRHRKDLAAFISIAAVMLFALTFFLTYSRKEMPKQNKNFNMPTVVKTPPRSTIAIKKKTPLFTKELHNNGIEPPAPELEKIMGITTPGKEIDELVSKSGDYTDQLTAPASSIPEISLKPNTEDVKISFRRGKRMDVQSVPEIRITFKQGAKTIDNLKQVRSTDTSYYANTSNRFKLKLRSAHDEN